MQRNGLKHFFGICLLGCFLLATTTSCTKNDDIQCGDELNPCTEIVADEIVDG